MDIHRARFVHYPASPINAIAFSRSSDRDVPEPKPALKLAIGRANGSIELWSAEKGDWTQEHVIAGRQGRSIEGLVWTQDPNETDLSGGVIVGQLRLFSIDSTAAVTEWNLSTGQPLRISTGNFSEVWCIAVQPRQRLDYTAKEGEWTGQDLVVGCGDGTLALLTSADSDLTFKRFLARSGSRKTRCMSVTWQNRDTVIAGFSDSTIRAYDVRSGSVIRTMSLGAGLPGASKNVLVWRIKCLPNGDIVSVDSNGQVVFWNGQTYSMSQRIAGHDSDCLDLITSTDGQTVFSGGIDGKIAVYKATEKDGNKRKWAKISHRRVHQGDLKSMSVYDSKQMSVVVTGGADTVPTVLPLRQFNKENHRRLPGLPQTQPLVSAPHARLLVSWWEQNVYIWRIGQQDSLSLAPSTQSRQLVGGVRLEGEDDISSVAISPDGGVLAVATATATKLFHLRPSRNPLDSRLRCRPIASKQNVSSTGARLLGISPDSHWLARITTKNDITMHRIVSEDDGKHRAVLPPFAELEPVFRTNTSQSGLGRYESTITRLAFSADSSLLCTSDLAGHIDTFALTGTYSASAPAAERVVRSTKAGAKNKRAEDSDSDSSSDDDEEDLPLSFHGQVWTRHASSDRTPRLDSQALVLAFHPERGLEHLLLAVTQHQLVYELDVRRGKLSEWSRRNPSWGVLPSELRGIKDRVMGLVWDYNAGGGHQSQGQGEGEEGGRRLARAWLYGSSWLGMLDVSQDFGAVGRSIKGAQEEGEGEEAGENASTDLVLAGKRKRVMTTEEEQEEREQEKRAGERKRRKGTSGAGDMVLERERGGVVTIADNGVGDPDAMVLDDEEEEEQLGPLRRRVEDSDEAEDGSVGDADDADSKHRRKWWCTFKYRPILGVVPLARYPVEESDRTAGVDARVVEREPMEIVLVERPHWDLEHVRK